MTTVLYRTEKQGFLFNRSMLSHVNYEVSVLVDVEESEALGIEYKPLRGSEFVVGDYYITDNDKVVNLIAEDAKKFWFAQFSIEKKAREIKDVRVGMAYSNTKFHNAFLGDRVTPVKLQFFCYTMFPRSPLFGDPIGALRKVLKNMNGNSGKVNFSTINMAFVDVIFQQKWINNISKSPLGKYIMSSLKLSLRECGVSYDTVISGYVKLTEQIDDRKAALQATKELERLIKESEAEDKRLAIINDGDTTGFEVPKRIGDGVDEIQDAILEAAEELDELGIDYVNQGLNVEEVKILN